MALTLEKYVKEGDAIVQILLEGSLDSLSAPQFDDYIAEHVSPSTQLVVLNMKHLEYISSAGIRSVFKLVKQLKANGSRVGVANRQPQITKVFEIIQALPDLQIFVDDNEMDQYLNAVQEKIISGEDF